MLSKEEMKKISKSRFIDLASNESEFKVEIFEIMRAYETRPQPKNFEDKITNDVVFGTYAGAFAMLKTNKPEIDEEFNIAFALGLEVAYDSLNVIFFLEVGSHMLYWVGRNTVNFQRKIAKQLAAAIFGIETKDNG
jgi:hypothetical protein